MRTAEIAIVVLALFMALPPPVSGLRVSTQVDIAPAVPGPRKTLPLPDLKIGPPEIASPDGVPSVGKGLPSRVVFSLENAGQGDANGIRVTIRPVDKHVEARWLEAGSSANIPPGKKGKFAITVTVGEDFDGERGLPLKIELSTRNPVTTSERVVTLAYDGREPPPRLEVVAAQAESANGEPFLSKGRSRVVLTIKNNGEGDARGVGVLVEPGDRNVAVESSGRWWKPWSGESRALVRSPGDASKVSLPRGESMTVAFEVEIAAAFRGGNELPLSLTLMAGAPRTSSNARVLLPYREPVAAAPPPSGKEGTSKVSAIFGSTMDFLSSTTRKLFGSSGAKVSVPAQSRAFTGNDHAVVVGIEHYRGGLPNSDYSNNDAQLVKGYLLALGFEERNIDTLTDERATLADIRASVERKLKNRITRESRVFFYYSGHGAPDPVSGEGYIVPFDGDPSYLADTGYPLSRLYDSLGRLNAAEVTVVLDSCFSGTGGRGLLAKGVRPLVVKSSAAAIPSNVAVLTSTSGVQISTTHQDGKHGLFTWYFLKAISEGKKNLAEIYQFVRPQVADDAKRQNVEQTPSVSIEGAKLETIFVLQK
ncbi:caspase family protein [Geomonas sp. Red32]|uniref:caspase family protein n=1 Tax=Geomonas sp. Red32 TaxID=2912856 RepID=UPI00202CCD83|nr:caspase family protein [Geomonas sp. Red32]MCM0080561.1 caspase family protein [Geomonas sp. Red32]